MYQAIVYTPTPARAAVVSRILRETSKFETVFTDYNKACDDACMECTRCRNCMMCVARTLAAPDSYVWEVWEDGETLVGILYLTNIEPGYNALAHYVFFDGNLRDKTDIIDGMIEHVFSMKELNLPRLTVAIPDFAYALARHAHTKLGFGGDFKYEYRGRSLPVEGVLRNAFMWRGMPRNLLLLGRLR